MGIVYLDGEYLPEEEAKISPLDRGFLSRDGIFTTLKVENGTVHFLPIHLERLKKQCEVIYLQFPQLDPEIIREVIYKNEAFEGVWKMKIVLSRGEDHSMHLPEKYAQHIFVFIKPFRPIPYGPLRATIFPISASTAHAKVKSLANLNRFCAMEYAKRSGYDDTITIMENGTLLEFAFANLFWKCGNQIYLPDPKLPYYFGVTVTNVSEILKELGLTLKYVQMKLEDIPKTAQVYRCNTMTAIRPVVEIQGHLFSRDENFEAQMQQEYQKRVNAFSLHCRDSITTSHV